MDDLLVYSGSLPPVATHAQGILPTLRPPMKPYIITLRDPNLNDDVIGRCGHPERVGFEEDIQFTNNRHVVVAPSKVKQLTANQGMNIASTRSSKFVGKFSKDPPRVFVTRTTGCVWSVISQT